MNNADKVRSMGDQELGAFLCDLMKYGCKMCPARNQEYCEDDIMLWAEEEYDENTFGATGSDGGDEKLSDGIYEILHRKR